MADSLICAERSSSVVSGEHSAQPGDHHLHEDWRILTSDRMVS